MMTWIRFGNFDNFFLESICDFYDDTDNFSDLGSSDLL